MRKVAKLLCIAGIVALFVGFIYDAAFINIPPQDHEGAPATVTKHYDDQVSIANNIYLFGKIVFAFGIGLWVAHFCKTALAKKH